MGAPGKPGAQQFHESTRRRGVPGYDIRESFKHQPPKMNQVLSALYDLLCFTTEDAVAHKLLPNGLPQEILDDMNALANKLGKHLEEVE